MHNKKPRFWLPKVVCALHSSLGWTAFVFVGHLYLNVTDLLLAVP